MSKKTILEIMQGVHSIHPDVSVEKAIQMMSSQAIDALLIKQEEDYTGIFTKTDLIKILEKNINPAEVSVSTIMSKPILSLDEFTPIEEAREKMIEKNIRHFAVTQKGKIIGLISIKDITT